MYSKKINKVVKNETHEQQVMRVVKEMVASGELVTKKSKDGETLYGLPERKAKLRKEISGLRSEAAKKAWITIRKNKANKEAVDKRSEAAKKAWVTRKSCGKRNTAQKINYDELIEQVIIDLKKVKKALLAK